MTNTSPISSGLHVVLGAGPVGHAIATALADQGASVRIVSRSGGQSRLAGAAEHRAADLSRPDQAAASIKGASVVYHCAAPAYQHWVRDFPALQDSIVQAVSSIDARLVVLDNLYAYGVAGTLTEDLPYAATGPKGRLRARMSDRLLADHDAGRIDVTIARSSDFLGPQVRMSALGERFWPQLLTGKTVQWFGNPDAPHSFTYVPDLAQAMIVLGSHVAARGRAWHVPSQPAVSLRDLVARAAELAGQPVPKITVTPKIIMRLVGLFAPAAAELIEVNYQFTNRFEISDAAYRDTFGGTPTDFDMALSATIDWWRQELNLPVQATRAA